MFSNLKDRRARPLEKMGRVQSSYVLSLTHSGRGTRHVRSPKTKATKAIPASVNLSAGTGYNSVA